MVTAAKENVFVIRGLALLIFALITLFIASPVAAADTDNDGVDDAADNCPTVGNPYQFDLDGDGVGNVCDPEGGAPDADSDGWADSEDNCPNNPNPRQYDTDGDGLGNVCDPGTSDSDSDGWADTEDNCPDDPNPRQYDLDGDGTGVVCDPDITNVNQNTIDRFTRLETQTMNAIARTLWDEAKAVEALQQSLETESDGMIAIIRNRNGDGAIINCTACHADQIGPVRAITGSNGDFTMPSHHIQGSPTDFDCLLCHYTGDHRSGTVKLIDPDVATVIHTYDPANPSSVETFCVNCHDSDGSRSGYWLTPFSDEVTVPDIKSGHYGLSCTDCHTNPTGFNGHVPGHGDGTDTGCEACHGHDAGYEYDTDLHLISEGRGTSHSHSTHTENDTDDLRGPNVTCDACHDTNNFPYFKSGTDSDADGKYNLAETDVCDACHSNDGPFAGVTDVDFGAKNNWANGVYDANGLLTAGKEQWCASCHDSGTSVISGVSAPNVAGDSSQTWGYYSTGHSTNLCTACHDSTLLHIDSEPRTYAYTGPPTSQDLSASPNIYAVFVAQPYSLYQQGYRLNMVDGDYPLRIPKVKSKEAIDETTDFNLCLQCHESSNFFNDTPPFTTNFNNSGPYKDYGKAYFESNSHRTHLYAYFPDFDPDGGPEFPGDDMWYDSDWDPQTGVLDRGGADASHSCVTCHNVHGSSYPVMIRDGKLSGRTVANGFEFDGLPFAYIAEDGTFPAVTSEGVNLQNSIGGVIRASSRSSFNGICTMQCHTAEVAPAPAYNASYDSYWCGICHTNWYESMYPVDYEGYSGVDYFRVPIVSP